MNIKTFVLQSALALSAMVGLSSCGKVDPVDAKRVLQSQGLTDINLTGYSTWFSGCGKDDPYNNQFTAKDSSGHDVSGVICGGGWSKGYTVRYF